MAKSSAMSMRATALTSRRTAQSSVTFPRRESASRTAPISRAASRSTRPSPDPPPISTAWLFHPRCGGLALLSGAADLTRFWLARGSFDVIAQDDRFRDFFHRYAPLAALPLQRDIGLLFAQLQIPLQDSFRALDDFPRFQLLGKL